MIPFADCLFLSGDLSYVRGTKDPRSDLGILSKNLAEIPPLRGRIDLRYDQGRFFTSIEGIFSAAQRKIDEDLSEEETASYTIVDLLSGFRYRNFTIAGGVGNLFNRTFAEHLSYQRDPFRSGVRVTEPGRNLFLNSTFDF